MKAVFKKIDTSIVKPKTLDPQDGRRHWIPIGKGPSWQMHGWYQVSSPYRQIKQSSLQVVEMG